MKKTLIFLVACLFLLSMKLEFGQPQKTLPAPNLDASKVKGPQVVPDFGKVPLYFISNQGQVDKQALYYAKTRRYTLWMTQDGLVFEQIKSEGSPMEKRRAEKGSSGPASAPSFKTDVSQLLFLGANKNAEVVGIEGTEYKVNYYIGNNPEKWKTDIKTSKAVLYSGIYKDIDLKVYGVEKQVEYDWVVKPGGNPAEIGFAYRGAKGTRLDEEGNLIVETSFGKLLHQRPASYQEISGEKRPVDVRFKAIGEDCYGFEVREYDQNHILVIDPLIMIYSTYLGGSSAEIGEGIAVDSSGCSYAVGYTGSSNFPTASPYDGSVSSTDAYLTKFSKDGKSLVYSTYLGGSAAEIGFNVSVDANNCAFIAGYTTSTDFPTYRSVQNSHGGGTYDVFVTKFSSSGGSLVFSTYLGGSDWDIAYGIHAETEAGIFGSSYAYITGYTRSANFPTSSAYQGSISGAQDAFVTKLYSYYSGFPPTQHWSVEYSTYLGGSNSETGYGIAVRDSYAYVTGETTSSDFPTQWSSITNSGANDAFVTCFSQDGASLSWSTYLGGSGGDLGTGIAVDNDNYAYVAGYTFSSDFPVVNSYDATFNGGSDVFFTKLYLRLRWIINPFPPYNIIPSHYVAKSYSTYLGGSGTDRTWDGGGTAIALDNERNIYITGYTISTDFPKVRAYDSTLGGDRDAFISMFSQETSLQLRYSTYLGGSLEDWGTGIAADPNNGIYITGNLFSANFPVLNAVQSSYGGGRDTFVTKFFVPKFRIDFNKDWQEDILWRYYGAGGHNAVWYMGYTGGGGVPAGIQDFGQKGALGTDFPKGGKLGTIRVIVDMLGGKEPPRVFRDALEIERLLEGGGWKTMEIKIPAGVQILKDPREMAGAGEGGLRVMGLSYLDAASLPSVTDTNWEIAGTGDFNKDGKPDILWRHYGTGSNVIWYMDGVAVIGWDPIAAVTNTNWRIVGTGDFNKDGRPDILWRYYGAGGGGLDAVWYMDGATYLDAASLPSVIDTNWRIVGTGDFNQDGKPDIVWRHDGVGSNLVWYMDGVSYIGWDVLPTVTDTNWRIEGTGDFNQDGKPDIIWRHYGTGSNLVWYLDGVSFLGWDSIPAVMNINWRIQSH